VSAEGLRVTVWNENIHERIAGSVPAELYPDGMHSVIADALRARLDSDAVIRVATMEEPEHGLSAESVDATDVLLWWGHADHDGVDDFVVDRVHRAVLGGMGLIVLHSAHHSKIFRRLMGTTCALRWRNDGERELVWSVAPDHSIARGIDEPLMIERHEMYGEPFDIPNPDELVFISSFAGGEVFRSGATWRRGHGRVFFFSPGDQEYPVYHHSGVQQVLANGVLWAAPTRRTRPGEALECPRAWYDS